MQMTRRAAVAGAMTRVMPRDMTGAMACATASAMTAAPAVAQAPGWQASLRGMEGFRPWTPSERPGVRLLNTNVQTLTGQATVRAWLGGRPTVLVVWASWCPPCMSEKRWQAALATYLTRTGARAQLKALNAFDHGGLPQARDRLDRLGAQALETGLATERAQQALLYIFGLDHDARSTSRTTSHIDALSTSLPFSLLFAADGTLLGQMIGAVRSEDGASYWLEPSTLDLLSALAQAPNG